MADATALGLDSAGLLVSCVELAGRPDTDKEMNATTWYRHLTGAQRYYYQLFSTHFPKALVGAPVKLTSSDDGHTYDFKDGDGDPITPMGQVEIRARRNGELMMPSVDWDRNGDYVIEGTRIRIPNGRSRQFQDGPWARYVAPPTVISESVQPTLLPMEARELLIPRAVYLWATRSGMRDPSPYLLLEQKLWSGDPLIPGDAGLLGMMRKQFLYEGSVSRPGHRRWWYNNPDLTP